MSDRSIFRREALEHRAAGAGPGELVRLSSLWTTWGFWILVVAIVAAVAASMVIEVDESVDAPAQVGDARTSLTAFVPAPYGDDLEVGMPVTVVATDGGTHGSTISAIGEALEADAEPSSDGPTATGPVIPISVALSGDLEPSLVRLRIERPLLFALIPGLGDLLDG